MRSVNRVEDRRLRIERHVAADRDRRLFSVPNIARAAGCVSSDTERRMMVSDTETEAISIAQYRVFIRQFEARVEIVSIEKLHGGFCHISVQVENFAAVALVVAAPDQTRRPVAARERLVVTERSRRAAHVAGLERFRISQKSVTHLHGPV